MKPGTKTPAKDNPAEAEWIEEELSRLKLESEVFILEITYQPELKNYCTAQRPNGALP